MNIFDNIINGLKEIPDKLSNISSKTLNEYGNIPIQSLLVLRAPLKPHWTESLNLFSFGMFNKYKEKNNLNVLYHLSLIAYVNDTPIIIEKNENIKIAPLENNDKMTEKGAEMIPINLNSPLTLNKMMDNTLNFMGKTKFYDYDALGVDGISNNCQDFVTSILFSNNLSTHEALSFIKQPTHTITNDLNNSFASYLPKLTKGVTNLGSRLSRFLGRGKKKVSKQEKLLFNYIKYMDKKGWEFL